MGQSQPTSGSTQSQSSCPSINPNKLKKCSSLSLLETYQVFENMWQIKVNRIFAFEISQINNVGKTLDLRHCFLQLKLENGTWIRADLYQKDNSDSIAISFEEVYEFEYLCCIGPGYGDLLEPVNLGDVIEYSLCFPQQFTSKYKLWSNNCYHFCYFVCQKFNFGSSDIILEELETQKIRGATSLGGISPSIWISKGIRNIMKNNEIQVMRREDISFKKMKQKCKSYQDRKRKERESKKRLQELKENNSNNVSAINNQQNAQKSFGQDISGITAYQNDCDYTEDNSILQIFNEKQEIKKKPEQIIKNVLEQQQQQKDNKKMNNNSDNNQLLTENNINNQQKKEQQIFDTNIFGIKIDNIETLQLEQQNLQDQEELKNQQISNSPEFFVNVQQQNQDQQTIEKNSKLQTNNNNQEINLNSNNQSQDDFKSFISNQ